MYDSFYLPAYLLVVEILDVLFVSRVLRQRISHSEGRMAFAVLVLVVQCFVSMALPESFYLRYVYELLLALVLVEGKLGRKLSAYAFAMGNSYYLFGLMAYILGWQQPMETDLGKLWQATLTIAIITLAEWCIMTRHKSLEEWLKHMPAHFGFIACLLYLVGAYSLESINPQESAYSLWLWTAYYLLVLLVILYGGTRLELVRTASLRDQNLTWMGTYFEALKQNQEETRRIKHDMQGHLMVAQEYLSQGDYQKAAEYLNRVNVSVADNRNIMFHVNNELAEVIIGQFAGTYRDIAFRVEGQCPAELPLEDYDFTTIFYNLLKNAVEAVEPLENKWIYLLFSSVNGRLYLEIRNPLTVGEVDLTTSSKQDKKNHGFGLINVRLAVAKYHGDFSCRLEEGLFVAEVTI